MGFHVNASQFDAWLAEQQKNHDVYALKLLTLCGRFVGLLQNVSFATVPYNNVSHSKRIRFLRQLTGRGFPFRRIWLGDAQADAVLIDLKA